METTHPTARDFVWEMLRTGIALGDLAESLIDALPAHAYPGEDHGEVVLDMMAGSIQPAVDAAGPDTVERVIALMAAAYDRVLTDLEAARDIREAARRPPRRVAS
jgi:hypothetical protein